MTIAGVFALAVALVLVGLIVATRIGVAVFESRHPPIGAFADVGGYKLHYVDLPAETADGGPPIVFLHGASANLHDQLAAYGERLRGRGRLIFVDRPGHGWSERGGRANAAPARQAEAVRTLLDRLGIDRAILVGHSWSGALITAFALAYPERTAGLVFTAPVSHPWPGGILWYYRLGAMPVIGRIFSETIALPAGYLRLSCASNSVFAPGRCPDDYFDKAATALVLRPAEFRANAQDVADLYDHVVAQSKRYGEIKAPTAVVTGTLDRVVLPSIHSKGLERDIAGARLIEINGIGHAPHYSARDEVIRAIEDVIVRARPKVPVTAGE